MSMQDIISLDGITFWMMVKFCFWWICASTVTAAPFILLRSIIGD